MEQIVAGLKEEDPNSEFKLYSWDGELLASVLPIMLEKGAFKEVNWNWDNKIKKEKQILKKIEI